MAEAIDFSKFVPSPRLAPKPTQPPTGALVIDFSKFVPKAPEAGGTGVSPVPPLRPAASGATQPVEEQPRPWWAATQRGAARLGQGFNTMQYVLGLQSPEDYAKGLSESERQIASVPVSEGEKRLAETEGFWDTAGEIVKNPGVLVPFLLENIPYALPSIAGGVAGAVGGAVAGGPAGAVLGGKLGGTLGGVPVEYGASFVDYLRQKGIDTTNEAALSVALADENLVNEAHWFAAKRAGAVAAFDYMTASLGTRIAPRFFSGTSLGTKARGVGVEVGVGAAGEAGGEAAAGIVTTGFDAKEVFLEGLAGGLMNLPLTVAPHVMGEVAARRPSEQVPPSEEQVRGAVEALRTGVREGQKIVEPFGVVTEVEASRERPLRVGEVRVELAKRPVESSMEFDDVIIDDLSYARLLQRLRETKKQEERDRILRETYGIVAGRNINRETQAGAGVELVKAEGKRPPFLRLVYSRPDDPSILASKSAQEPSFFETKEWKRLIPAAERSIKTIEALAKQFKIPGIRVTIGEQSAAFGEPSRLGAARRIPGGYQIALSVGNFTTAERLYATMAHEFGHVVAMDKWGSAGKTDVLAIQQAYDNFLSRVDLNQEFPEFIRRWGTAVRARDIMRKAEDPNLTIPRLIERSPAQINYWTGFAEWFAEQTARWATTSERPLSLVDRFFSSLGKRLRQVFRTMEEKTGLGFRADKAVEEWLDSFVQDVGPGLAQKWLETERRGRAENRRGLDAVGERDVDAPPPDGGSGGGRRAGDALFGGRPPDRFRGMAAGADRFNAFYKWMLSLLQVAARNKNVRSLQHYRETVQTMNNERIGVMDKALQVLTEWQRLGGVKARKLSLLVDDYMNMRYLSREERENKVRRKPTEAEFRAMVAEHGVTDDGLAVFTTIVRSFDEMLTRYQQVLEADARKIEDPIAQAEALQDIGRQIERLRKQPYFPAMRFGKWSLTIRDREKHVVHYETFDTKRQREAAAKLAKGSDFYPPDIFDHSVGVVPETTQPLFMVPPGLLNLIGEKLDLSATQREMLDELRFELAPSQSFKHRFQRKRLVSGYSQDFMRAYANYFFHGANFFGRVKYADQLHGYVKDVREQAKWMPDGTRRGMIANFMDNHLAEVLNPSADLVKLRGLIFHFALGFSPAAAAANLTQMLVGSAPFLASKFGDVKAAAAMVRAGTQVSTLYREGTLTDVDDVELNAIARGIREGVVTEAMAPHLAGISEGRNLGKRFGSDAEELWYNVSKMSAGLFQASEQLNRRITFRAAWKLAWNNPAARHVRDSVLANELLYTRLVDGEGLSHREAAAYIVAKDAVESTQFIYASWARPRFMRGKAGTLFIFKSFVQNTLFMLWANPGTRWRSLLVMGALGGLMGIPGTEDLNDMLKVIAYRLFGKDFDLEREVRRYVTEVSNLPPDVMLHGLSRRGFGLPFVVDAFGGPQLPDIDMSRSVGIGAISPVPLATLAGPTADVDQAISQTLQRSSGAAFGYFFNVYRALQEIQQNPADFKSWERMLPRSAASVSRAYRAWSEGMERTRSGAPIARFDPSNPEHDIEMLAMAMGFQPLRVTGEWDRIAAIADVERFYDLRRAALMRQMDWAVRTGDREAIDEVRQAIISYNSQLPDMARGKAITSQQLRSSLRERARGRVLVEEQTTRTRAGRPIAETINRLYPEVAPKVVQ